LLCRAPLYLYARPDITSLEGLRGRTIAANRSIAGSFVLRIALADAGIGNDDWTALGTGGARTRLQALLDGRADAALLSPPNTIEADAAGLTLLLSLPERYPQLLYSTIQVRTDFAQHNAGELVRMLRADIRAQAWLYDPAHRDDAVTTLTAAYDLTATEASACYDALVVRDRVYCTDAALDPAGIELVANGLVRFGRLRRALPLEAYFDLRYVNEARRERMG
jgi:ABC-type nitrate/sulfonate/bicarbonate transport system substrate-binding protein